MMQENFHLEPTAGNQEQEKNKKKLTCWLQSFQHPTLMLNYFHSLSNTEKEVRGGGKSLILTIQEPMQL